jgi:hypothetical protein
MKCDICGKETKGDLVFDTHSDRPSGYAGGNPTVPLQMCRACYDARNATQRFMAWSILLIAGGLLAAALLAWIAS